MALASRAGVVAANDNIACPVLGQALGVRQPGANRICDGARWLSIPTDTIDKPQF